MFAAGHHGDLQAVDRAVAMPQEGEVAERLAGMILPRARVDNWRLRPVGQRIQHLQFGRPADHRIEPVVKIGGEILRRLRCVETYRRVHAQPAHRSRAEIESGGIAPAAIVDDEGDAPACKRLRHLARLPAGGKLLRSRQHTQDIGAIEVTQSQDVAIARHSDSPHPGSMLIHIEARPGSAMWHSHLPLPHHEHNLRQKSREGTAPMALIASIETGLYRIPLSVTLSDSTHGAMTAFELITCRVRDADGAEGVGYTYTVGRNGGAVADIVRREIPDLIAVHDADDTEAIWHRVWWGLHYGGRGGPVVLALSALDIALWDLKARRATLPLFKLLGGFDAGVPCYAGGIDLDLSNEALLKQTDDNLAKGFRAIKMKVGRPDLGADVARVAAMREHLGDGFPLMADANMKWTVEEAIRAARALQPFDLTWLEEPTIPDDIAGHARILAAGGVPIAAGENLRSLWDFKTYIASGALSYPEPDVTNCGGVTSFMKIARLAEAFNLPVTSHGAHDVTVHLLAACPNRSFLEAHGFGLDRFIEHPLLLENGLALAPARPGHGITFDWEGLAKLAA